MTERIFDSPAILREAFVDGLARMLAEHHNLGVFILVLANATYDKGIYQHLQASLRDRFDELSDRIRTELRAGRQVSEAPDDLLVFLKLMAVGFDKLELTRFRRAGRFELQYNPLRAYRPPRMSDVSVDRLSTPFDPDGFHFNKPFLAKEVFWSGMLHGHSSRLLYNKFPFAQLHGLLVIGPENNKPQWLSETDHQLVWTICEALGQTLPGIGFGYNGYGAYASVNHLHLQMFVREGEYPIEDKEWQHRGGVRAYPTECHLFSDMQAAWVRIHELHEQGRTYNLLYRPGRLYLMPRRYQGSYEHAAWTSGFAWAEVCGSVTTFNSDDFDQLDAAAISAEMEKLRP